jgi:hypothetical protein
MASVYETPIAAVRFGITGWAQLPSGRWVNRLPPLDTSNPGLFAVLDYQSTLLVAARDKLRLIRPDTLVELNQHGLRIEPVILPDAAQRVATPRRPGEKQADYEGRLRVDMSSLDWVRRHAEGVWAELHAEGWDGTLPVANAGKPWVDGAPAGKSRLMGWSKRASSSKLGPNDFSDWYQPLQVAHNREHKDYSSLPAFESDLEPTWLLLPEPVSADPQLFPETAVLKAISELGTRETTGHNDGAQIAKFFSGATRLINGVEKRTGWASGWEWCAAFYGWCGGRGWRIAVHEYVTDAKKSGTWRARDSGYAPKRGDGVVLSRANQDPTRGGLGHICRIETSPDAAGAYVTIGGNEDNQVKRTTRSLEQAELRGFLEN